MISLQQSGTTEKKKYSHTLMRQVTGNLHRRQLQWKTFCERA